MPDAISWSLVLGVIVAAALVVTEAVRDTEALPAVPEDTYPAVVTDGVTETVFCGHDHLNNFGVEYGGVLLSYIEPSGYGAYGMDRRDAPPSDWLQGYTKLELLADGTVAQTQTRYAEVYGD